MSETYDVVVAGGGHNALVAAAYLTRAGFECCVLDARPVLGGDTASEELTLPGFRHDTCSTAHNLIQASPLLRDDELRLGEFGLEYLQPDPVVHLPFPDGTWLTQWRDLDRTCAEFARFSRGDARAFRRMMEEYDGAKAAFGAYRYTPIGWGLSLPERLAALPAGRRWLRGAAGTAWGVSMFVTHYATSEPPRYTVDGGELAAVASGAAESVDRLLRLGWDVRRRALALDEPPLLVVCPTVADPARAPAGKHTLKVIGLRDFGSSLEEVVARA